MTIRTSILIVASLLASQISFAGVLVKAKELGSGASEIKIEGNWARLTELSTPQQFMLVDLHKQVSYIANRDQKLMIRMDDMNFTNPEAQTDKSNQKKPAIELIKSGTGPKVAGFKTTRYLLKANNQLCSEHFISMDVLKIPEIKLFSASIEKLSKSPQYLAEHQTACEFAEIEFEQMAFSKGVPLLTKDNKGKVTFRVNEIKTGVSFGKNEVAPPSDYETVTAQQMMHRQMNRALDNM